jgi:hypothetical protein
MQSPRVAFSAIHDRIRDRVNGPGCRLPIGVLLVRNMGCVLPLLVTAFIAAGCSGCPSERFEGEFETYEEAVLRGQSGWLPKCMPRSAAKIIAAYNYDTNEKWAVFSFDVADTDSMISRYREIDESEVVYPRKYPTLRMRWWPEDLRGPATTRPAKYKFYHGVTKSTAPAITQLQLEFLAVSTDSAWAWYWHLERFPEDGSSGS